MQLLLLVVTVAGLACSRNHHTSSAQATVVDDRVEFEVHGDPRGKVTVGDLPAVDLEALAAENRKPSLPLDHFKDGENTVDVKFEADGEVTIVKATFTKEPGSGGPFMRLAGCDYPTNGASTGHVSLDGGPLGKFETCWLWSDNTIHIKLAGTRGAKVTIGTQRGEVDATSGTVEIAYPVLASVLHAPIETALGDGAGIGVKAVPITLTTGSTTLDGTLDVDASPLAQPVTAALLKGVVSGTPMPRDGEAAINKHSLVYIPPTEYQPKHLGKPSKVSEVGLVAVGRDLDSKPGPKCGPYGTQADGPKDAMVESYLVDVEVQVYDATGAVVASKRFAGNYEECPMIAISNGGVFKGIVSRPDPAAIERWLTGVAAKTPS